MAQEQVSPVARGKTFFGPSQTITTTTADYVTIENGGPDEGTLVEFPHTDPADKTKVLSHRKVRAVLMRNQSGITMYAGRIVTSKSGYDGLRFDGYCTTDYQYVAGVIDDHLPAGGVRNGDLCWVIFDGPAYVYKGRSTETISAGAVLIALTAATSQAVTAGRAAMWDGLTCTQTETTDAVAAGKHVNRFGRAISAATAAETDTKKLADIFVRP